MSKLRQAAAFLAEVRQRLVDMPLVWICLICLVMSSLAMITSRQVHLVTIHDNGALSRCYTVSEDVQQILSRSGITLGAYDEVRIGGFADRVGLLEIRRAFPVTIHADGNTRRVMTTATQLGTLLDKEGITLGELDEITGPASGMITGDAEITIRRVREKYVTETEEIPFGVSYRSSSLLPVGRSRTISEGVPGELTTTFRTVLVEGEETEREELGTEITRESANATVLIGSDAPVSPLDFGVVLDANGEPLHYTKVLRNQICTGYSGRGKRVRGASREWLSAGSVAVRAAEIPYGTRMYIRASDGGHFIYGCAVAADTGTALQQNIIDVDLFYDTYMESYLNGRKICDVFILD